MAAEGPKEKRDQKTKLEAKSSDKGTKTIVDTISYCQIFMYVFNVGPENSKFPLNNRYVLDATTTKGLTIPKLFTIWSHPVFEPFPFIRALLNYLLFHMSMILLILFSV